jgi:hypothetical protein
MGNENIAFAALLLVSIALIVPSSDAQVIGVNTSREFANRTINNALSVIDAVNQSGYLIFYPNLTQAYAYLNRSMTVLNASPEASVVLANKASNEAMSQYEQIGAYRQQSLVVMLALTVVLAVLLSRLLRPVAVRTGRKSKKG